MNRKIFDELPEFEGRKEFIDKVMSEHGADIEKAKADLVDAQKANAEYQTQIEELNKAKGDTETLTAKLEEYKKQIEAAKAAENERVFNENMMARFNAVVGDAKFINDFTRDAIFSQFKDAAKSANGASDKDIYAKLTGDGAGIFAQKQQFANMHGVDVIDQSLLDAERFKAMSLVEQMAFANDHPKEYAELSKA